MSDNIKPLIRAYLDSEATESDLRALDHRLALEPRTRQALLEEATFDVQLRAALKRQVEGGGGVPSAGEGGGQRSGVSRFHSLALGGALAAAAALAVVLGWVWWHVPASRGAGPAADGVVRPVPSSVAPPRPSPLAVVMQARGRILLSSPGRPESVAVHESTAIVPGDVMDVGRDAKALVQYADGSRLVVYGGTRLSFDSSGGGILLQVIEGVVDAVVERQPSGRPMVIYTGRMTAQVVGTELRVIDEKESSWLAVKSGHVLVFRNADGRRVGVSEGNYATVNPRVPFGRIPVGCPIWRGECRDLVGDQYP